ncbi:dTDP-4-dehydrorhamnose 3,5-epimerase [Brucella ovis IntaBari-2006-46-332]|nr:dTDP-4-dehydrorhamnose 3,5-epimerase [Brucella ovis 80/125]ENR06728.1 dTDP-4-dehydrorhamnose 3,5-epimerase [Brucella ovis F8/05B]ENS93359.1 dTDP-4-dehydrorhamnose 3,5-epimerase [Brucella ovis 63/96]ENS97824.1 dTDP-4-dehydrorhamnose 3,5-epimerase [Brucella ovis 81/8]ENT76159.1 dTDP-4-dehydrorhamnose 3,5-epimerase [Brucella ovis IntaBari-2009-88-4]ENT78402.1 dTDP-4-dehydrorhamnose 3,5-epimerase [Brucella ovis IntaBari-2006-46-348]ENT81951.1 dTDP-4-dehydrorhamnose 3,5-epimerase [Brucella ovis
MQKAAIGGRLMHFTPLNINGAWSIEPGRLKDERGWFARVYCEAAFAERKLETHFPQHSLSFSREKGTLRGLHYQNEPHSETKLVTCLQGIVWDVLVDLRPHSPTYRRWAGVELSAENGVQLYIPEGCAHGFQTLTDDVLIRYMISKPYAPDHAAGIRYDDPALDIPWPEKPSVISQKDLGWPFL